MLVVSIFLKNKSFMQMWDHSVSKLVKCWRNITYERRSMLHKKFILVVLSVDMLSFIPSDSWVFIHPEITGIYIAQEAP